jgi:hypothetical protein
MKFFYFSYFLACFYFFSPLRFILGLVFKKCLPAFWFVFVFFFSFAKLFCCITFPPLFYKTLTFFIVLSCFCCVVTANINNINNDINYHAQHVQHCVMRNGLSGTDSRLMTSSLTANPVFLLLQVRSLLLPLESAVHVGYVAGVSVIQDWTWETGGK